MILQPKTILITLIPELLWLVWELPRFWSNVSRYFTPLFLTVIVEDTISYLQWPVMAGLISLGIVVLISHFWKDSKKQPILLGVIGAMIPVLLVLYIYFTIIWG